MNTSLHRIRSLISIVLISGLLHTGSICAEIPSRRPPNFVIIFADDLGFQDLSCFGSPHIETPHLDRLAVEGRKFTSFYAAPSCSPSRAALLTGCYPVRVGIPSVLGPKSKTGLNPDELTLAELLKTKGYRTAIYGKWHLGDSPVFMPLNHGFDDYFGLPYSNDMWPFHPTTDRFPDLPLITRNQIIELNPDQTLLTTRYTEKAVQFIDQQKENPFFLYLPHSMPHVPLFVSSKYQGSSSRGLYSDVIREIDWSVGQIMRALRRNGIDDQTLVIFTSDNGPWLSYGNHAGSALPLREGKGTTFEGGVRVPCIMRWPDQIPAGTLCQDFASTMDILPTLCRLANAALPTDRIIDGKDIHHLMTKQRPRRNPEDFFLFFNSGELQAIRQGRWKLHFPHQYRSLKENPGRDGIPGVYVQKLIETALFDLESDIGEQHDISSYQLSIVLRLKTLAQQARKNLGDRITQIKGLQVRPPGTLPKDP
mgnify:CR=1 FL=1